jgi:hypothetical protein
VKTIINTDGRRAGWVRLCVLAVLVSTVATTAPAALANPHRREVSYAGSIRVAHPLFPISMFGAACNPTSPLNGIDGVWFRIPRGYRHVTMSPSELLEADVFFFAAKPAVVRTYTDGFLPDPCKQPDEMLPGTHLGDVLSGSVPAQASYVYVNGYLYTGSLTVTFTP